MPRTILLLSSLFVLLAVSVHAEFEVKTDIETGQCLIQENGKPVFQYNYKMVPLPEGYLESLTQGKEYAVPRSDYIHPLFGLNGEPITRDWCPDHAHHRGIYWAWPEVLYKGELADLHALQRVFARPTGKIETVEKNGVLTLQAENLWMWKDEEPIVHETAIMSVSATGKDGRKINLEFRFKGLVDEIKLSRRGQEHYGGLNIRMQALTDFKSGYFLSPEEDADRAAWVYGTWKDAKTGTPMELTVFEKADNPEYPGDYINYQGIHWFQSTFPKKGVRYSLKKDETLILRFQLWLHEATQDDAARKEAWKAFQIESR